MSWVIQKAGRLMTGKNGYSTLDQYKSAGLAVNALKKHLERNPEKYEGSTVQDSETFYATEPMVERTNLMSGIKYMEKLNMPTCCSPASETYWSM